MHTLADMPITQTDGQTASQFLEMGVAFVLSAMVGLERELRHKSAGMDVWFSIHPAWPRRS